ncbi:hypothetical protein V8C35DRAFT_333548 [Trichoderma chlorosporum]
MLPKWGTMTMMLLFGAAFAISHHFFYQSLSGRPAPSVVYLSSFGGGLSLQQINLAAGSTFAFLVHLALSTAVATAVDQSAWATIKKSSSDLELRAIDLLSTTTTSVRSVLNPPLWRKSPITMTLTVIFRLLSIPSLITPATLNVGWSVAKSTIIYKIPQVDFTSLNFAHMDAESASSLVYPYSAGSISRGRILPISSPYQNATWHLEFNGPALLCEKIEKGSALYNNITKNVLTTMVAGSKPDPAYNNRTPCKRSFSYISWVPTVDLKTRTMNALPFPDSFLNSSYRSPSQALGPLFDISSAATLDQALGLYIAALPDVALSGNHLFCLTPEDSFTSDALMQVANMSTTKCTMHNTSYVANFTYTNNIQAIKIAAQGSLNFVSGLSNVSGLYPPGGNGSYYTQKVKNLAYQAVMDAFGRMFVGSIYADFGSDKETGQSSQILDTQVAITSIQQTEDFNYVSFSTAKSLQTSVEGTPRWNGFFELFQNVTISLMSNLLLQPNYTSPYAPPGINVTLAPYVVVYSYAARALCLSYGIALGIALLGTLLGIVSIRRNGGSSYTTKFSTILRVAHFIGRPGPTLPTSDDDGKDPTPPKIEKSRILWPEWYVCAKTAESEEESLQTEDDETTSV